MRMRVRTWLSFSHTPPSGSFLRRRKPSCRDIQSPSRDSIDSRSPRTTALSVIEPGAKCLWFEDVIDMARAAVPTETQVMVKREDEQAFAELNAANPVFVEDAVRLFAEALQGDVRVGDFRVVASHQESLHSHDAVSLLTEGETFAAESLDPRLFQSLYHTG